MKIAFDARFLGPAGTGVGRYVDNLLRNLAQIDSKNEYIILLRPSNFHLFNPTKANFKKVSVNAHWYSLKEQILLPVVLNKYKPDIVHFPHLNVPLFWRGKFVVTIHDLILSKYEEGIVRNKLASVLPIKKAAYNLVLKKAVGSSEKILTPSKSTKLDILKNYQVSREKIEVIHEAADDDFIRLAKNNLSQGEKDKVLKSYGIKEPFILTVGNSFPYKNVENVLVAMKSLPNNLSLVHVSKRDYFAERLVEKSRELQVAKRFLLISDLGNDELGVLYKSAKAFVFPSLSEGFGLPGVEAMAAGCPVICSNITVFKEVYGKAAVYFNPKKSDDIAKKILLITNNPKLRTNLVHKGIKQSEKYSWRKLAQETLDVYNSF